MSYDGVGPLAIVNAIVNGSVTGAMYRRILQKHFLPLVAERQRRAKATILQYDNAPVHRASVVNNRCLESLEWPVQSPDLNPIKNFWMVLKKAIRKRCPPPKTLSDLPAVISEEWGEIPIEIVQTLIESMPRRVKQVIKAQRFSTKY